MKAVPLPQELLEYVHHRREERNLEFKASLDWSSKEHQCKLVKAVLGLANLRDGGVVVIGVGNDGTPVGVSEPAAAVLTQDNVQAVVSEYADPYVELTVTAGQNPSSQSAAWFVVIQVSEFEELPVICRKDGIGLKRGAIYTRSRRIHETAEVRSAAEMREILRMATEKGIRNLYQQAEAAGFTPTARPPLHGQLFADQLQGL